MPCDYDFVENDTGSVLRITCTDRAGNVIDLTGATVTLKWNDATGTLQQQAMAINAPATAGIVQYKFAAGELFSPSMYFSIKIQDSGGGVVHSNCVVNTKIRKAI